MRVSDYFDLSPSDLQKMWDANSLGSVLSAERPLRGSINYCLLVNGKYILRLNILAGKGPSRFKSEQIAYHELRGGGVPVPEVVALDLTKRVVPYDYLITSRLPGTPLVDTWDGLSEGARQQVSYAAGVYLAQIHRHTFKHFGNLRTLAESPFLRWYPYVRDYAERYIALAAELGGIDAPTTMRIRLALEKYRRLLDRVDSGSLVHSDYHFENILQKDGVVTGIIDFEWALSGDPTWDFIAEDHWEAMCPGSKKYIYEGYKSVRQLAENHELRVALYKLLMYLETVVDHRRDNNEQHYRATLAQLLSTLDMLHAHHDVG